MTDCRPICPIPDGGDCPRHGVRKSRRLAELCRTNERYWQAWEEGRGPKQNAGDSPSFPRRILTWAQAIVRWQAAGRPRRSDAEVESLLAICLPCERYRDGVCAKCGCGVSRSKTAIVNKLRMTTEVCPLGKWGGMALDFEPAEPGPAAPLTIVVTSFHRPDLLRRCLASVAAVPVPIVVSVAEARPDVLDVIREARLTRPDIIVTAQTVDCGCNELWLRGLYAARTPYVQILHDDDMLSPEYPAAYREHIAPALGRVHWIIWSGMTHSHGQPVKHHRLYRGQGGTGVYPSETASQATETDGYARSPVVQVFRRDLAIRTLKEAGERFGPEFYTRPGMMVGNDMLLGLRHAAEFPEVLFIDQALSYFGCWSGSETFQHRGRGSNRLAEIYNATRAYFAAHPRQDVFPDPKIIHVVNLWPATGDTRRRMTDAQQSWQRLYDSGAWVPCHVAMADLLVMGHIRPVAVLLYVKALGDKFLILEKVGVHHRRRTGAP